MIFSDTKRYYLLQHLIGCDCKKDFLQSHHAYLFYQNYILLAEIFWSKINRSISFTFRVAKVLRNIFLYQLLVIYQN